MGVTHQVWDDWTGKNSTLEDKWDMRWFIRDRHDFAGRCAETIEILFWNKSYSCESKLPLHRIVLEVIFNNRIFSDEVY